MRAKNICNYTDCPHNMLRKVFNTNKPPIITPYVEEAGACMRELSPEEEQEGLPGIRRGATQSEIAEIYGVRLFSVQSAEKSGLEKIQKRLGI